MPKDTNRSKFNVSKDTSNRNCDGIIFDSKAECDFYKEWLIPHYKTGEITEYQLQKKYILQPSFKKDGKLVRSIDYIADFYFVTKNGTEVAVDVKGMATPEAKMKRKMMWYVHPEVQFYWVQRSVKDGGWLEYDHLQKLRRERKKERNAKRRQST